MGKGDSVRTYGPKYRNEYDRIFGAPAGLPCPMCDGVGEIPGGADSRCLNCNGTGRVQADDES